MQQGIHCIDFSLAMWMGGQMVVFKTFCTTDMLLINIMPHC